MKASKEALQWIEATQHFQKLLGVDVENFDDLLKQWPSVSRIRRELGIIPAKRHRIDPQGKLF